jgi:hypothetical protein
MASVVESVSLGGYVTQYQNVNFSTSKQKYTFGKGQRFPSVMKKDTSAMCYDLP